MAPRKIYSDFVIRVYQDDCWLIVFETRNGTATMREGIGSRAAAIREAIKLAPTSRAYVLDVEAA